MNKMWVTNFYDDENLGKQYHLKPVNGLLVPMEVIGCKEVEKHYLSKQRVEQALINCYEIVGGDKKTCLMLLKELNLE